MMKRNLLATAVLAVVMSGCGGGPDPEPLAMCNGKPTAAIVYVGPGVPAELASIDNACVYTTEDPAALSALVDKAMAAAGVNRVHMIARGNAAPLDLMAARPGIANFVSLWFPPAWSGDLGGALATVYAHGPNRPTTSNNEGPVIWDPAVSAFFDIREAVSDLHLGLAN
jgi:hypothetical protein